MVKVWVGVSLINSGLTITSWIILGQYPGQEGVVLFQQGCYSRDRIEQVRGLGTWQWSGSGFQAQSSRTCRWGCLAGNGCFWIRSGWNLPPAHHTLLRGRFESCFYGGLGVMEGDFSVRGQSSNREHADSFTLILHGYVRLNIEEVLYWAFPRFLLVWYFEKQLDGWEAEFVNEVFPVSSDSLCIGAVEFLTSRICSGRSLDCMLMMEFTSHVALSLLS